MKKICFITTIPLTYNAFISAFAEYIHQDEEFQISVICDTDKEFEKSLPSYIHYIPVKMKRGISFSGILAVFHMFSIFRREKFDLIQYSTPNASFYASIAGRFAQVPVRLYCQWGIAYVGFGGLKRALFRLLEKITCCNSTCIEPDSFGNLHFSLSEGLYQKEKGHVVGAGSACGVNLDKFNLARKQEYRNQIRKKLNLSEQDLVIGFVGRLDRDKGINELLTSYCNIRNENTKLLLVGSCDKTATLDQELYTWSLQEKSIIYVGQTAEVEKYLAAMDIFVLPSYREGFGSVVIEAAAMELPVIVTDIPGPSEIIKDKITGLIVRKKNIDELTEAIRFMMAYPDQRRNYGEAGRRSVCDRYEQSQVLVKIYRDRLSLLKKK